MNKKVVIIGGGIAGLTTATLLCEQDFDVIILEASDSIGGLAKSKRLESGLPTEHSLRVYHETYACLFNLLKKIPYTSNTTVFDQLVPISFALECDKKFYSCSANSNYFIKRILGPLKLLWFCYQQGFQARDFLQLGKEEILIRVCYERLIQQVGHLTIGEFLANVSPHYLKIIHAFHQTAFVATLDSCAALAVKFDTEGKPFSFLAMANGPTSERIFEPWEKYLLQRGVEIRKQATVVDFITDNNNLYGVQLANGQVVNADLFVCAVSNLTFMKFIQSSSLRHFAGFEKIKLNAEWSNGIQFYLSDLPSADSNAVNHFEPGTLQTYLDSPWKLTSIIQGPGFWQDVTLPDHCRYVLSITCTAGQVSGALYQKPIWECSPQEIYAELLYQCHFKQQNLIVNWHLDDAIVVMTEEEYHTKQQQLAPHQAYKRTDGSWMLNFSPITVPTPEAFKTAPGARSAVKNLYLAGDFCQAVMFLPTMEKACETGFLAAQAISEDLNLPHKISLPFSAYNDKNHAFYRKLDAILFKLQLKLSRWFKRFNE